MTKYNLRNDTGRKILVPVVALLLCAFALVGAGYAALTQSSAISGGNEVLTEGIVVKFTDDNGDPVVGTIDADVELTYYNIWDHSVGGGNTFYFHAFDEATDVDGNRLIGETNLNIDATGSTATGAKVTYTLETYNESGTVVSLPSDLQYVIKIEGTELTSAGLSMDSFNTGADDNDYELEIYLTNSENGFSDQPLNKYVFKLTVFVEPTYN